MVAARGQHGLEPDTRFITVAARPRKQASPATDEAGFVFLQE